MYHSLLRAAQAAGIPLDGLDERFVCWQGPSLLAPLSSYDEHYRVTALHAAPHCTLFEGGFPRTLDLASLAELECRGVRACSVCLSSLPAPVLHHELSALREVLPHLESLRARLRELSRAPRRQGRWEEYDTWAPLASPWSALATAEVHLLALRRALERSPEAPAVARGALAAHAFLAADLELHRHDLQCYRSAAHLELAAAATLLALTSLQPRLPEASDLRELCTLTPRELALAELARESLRAAGALPHTPPHCARPVATPPAQLPPPAASSLPSSELDRLARAAARRTRPGHPSRTLRSRLEARDAPHLRPLLEEAAALLDGLRPEPPSWALAHLPGRWGFTYHSSPLPLRLLLDVLVAHWRVPGVLDSCTPPLVRLPPVFVRLARLAFPHVIELGASCLPGEPADLVETALRIRADACPHPHPVFPQAIPSFATALDLARACFEPQPPR